MGDGGKAVLLLSSLTGEGLGQLFPKEKQKSVASTDIPNGVYYSKSKNVFVPMKLVSEIYPMEIIQQKQTITLSGKEIKPKVAISSASRNQDVIM